MFLYKINITSNADGTPNKKKAKFIYPPNHRSPSSLLKFNSRFIAVN